jgi:hypothetical protein
MLEWLNKIEEQLSYNNIADLVNHAGGDHSEDGNERADEVNKMSHGRGTFLWGAGVNFPKLKQKQGY